MDSKLHAFRIFAFSALFGLVSPIAWANQPTDAKSSAVAVDVDGARRIEVGFSPEGSARDLVLRTINSASSSIRLSASRFSRR